MGNASGPKHRLRRNSHSHSLSAFSLLSLFQWLSLKFLGFLFTTSLRYIPSCPLKHVPCLHYTLSTLTPTFNLLNHSVLLSTYLVRKSSTSSFSTWGHTIISSQPCIFGALLWSGMVRTGFQHLENRIIQGAVMGKEFPYKGCVCMTSFLRLGLSTANGSRYCSVSLHFLD